MADLFEVTVPEMVAELEREIRIREGFYPKLIGAKRMTQSQADRRIATLRAIMERLQNG